MDTNAIERIAREIVGRRNAVALTGAGISTESGIPDFRSSGGLWEKYNPAEYATIDAFLDNPVKVWQMLKEMDELLEGAEPNPGHRGLARLEELGLLIGIVTQNVDNLHQEAGSRTVIEFHGNGRRLVCLKCRASRDARQARERWEKEFPPRCPQCSEILKPDVVLFGEPIPPEAGAEAMRMAQGAGVLLVIGTSAVVAPASYIPMVAKKMGAVLAEFNLEQTVLSDFVDHAVVGMAGTTVPALVAAVEALL